MIVMKFRLLTLAVVLLLGAVVNIAIAWSLSLRAWNPEHERERSGPATQQAMIWWRTHVPVGHAGNAITLYESWCFGRRVEYLFNAKSGNDASVLVARAAHGWPLVSMERASWRDRARQFR